MKNQTKLEKFLDSDLSDLSIYKKLSKKIRTYNSNLFPELTKTKEGKYVLIITPDGMKEGVEPTKKLFNARPELEKWIVKKYRQPCDGIGLNFGGIAYPSNDIEIIAKFENEDQVDIKVFVRNLDKDKKRYSSLAFLYLDHILGEFNTIMKVRYIDFYHLEDDQSVKGGITILELRKLIEQNLY